MKEQFKKIWPEWEIDSKIGSGSFGAVYKIKRTDEWGTYYSALKVIRFPNDESDVETLREQGMDDESITEYYYRYANNFYQEIALMEKLKGNSNIVSYEDHKILKHENGFGYDIYIRMQLLTPLNKRVQKQKMDQVEILKLGIDICKALELCDKNHILHRDIKPANIFISNDGEYKLGDFGIARIAENATMGTMTGTYSYIAPEIFNKERYDSRVDTYSLGLVLYQLLNYNRLPFMPPITQKITADDMSRAYQMRIRGEEIPEILHISSELNEIVLKACKFNQDERYYSAKEFRRKLEDFLNQIQEEEVVEGTIKLEDTEDETVGTIPLVNKNNVIAKSNVKSAKKSSKALIGIMIAVICVVILVVVFISSGLKEKNIEDASIEENTGSNIGEIDSIEITAGVNYILPGDEVAFYCKADEWILESSDKLTWNTDNSVIASITSDGILQAKKPGTITVTADYEGKQATRKVTVLEVDEEAAMAAVESNYDNIDFSETSETVTIEITLGEEIPNIYHAYAYDSCGTTFSWDWVGAEGNVLTMEVSNMFGTSQGVLTVYVTPENDPETVCGLVRITINE